MKRQDKYNNKINEISHELFGRAVSRKENRLIQIIEASIKLFAKQGFDETNLEQITKKCKVTRPLMNHYFSNKDELFQLVSKYIRLEYQKSVVKAMEPARSPIDRLRLYIKAAVEWGLNQPEHMSLWLVFFHKCYVHKEYRDLNTKLTEVGLSRIGALLEESIRAGEMSVIDVPREARFIQDLILATLTTLVSENLTENQAQERVENCVKEGLRKARFGA